MKGRELKDLSVEELCQKERELAAEMFNLRFRHATGQLENTMALRKTRKDIARVKTILSEKSGRGEAAR
jgi:large subunit ribosomal protein L29